MVLSPSSFLGVLLGGALGSLLRFLTQHWLEARTGFLPYGTITVNLLGSFLIGLLMTWAANNTTINSLRPLLVVGFLGGFTTFSGLTWDAYQILLSRGAVSSLEYLGISLFGGFVALAGGIFLGRVI